MTTAIKTRKKALPPKPISPEVAKKKNEKPKLVGLAVLLNANLPRSFESPAEVDAYIRDLRDEWDD